jgi:hypothetical protein
MPFGKELSHLIEEQINRTIAGTSSGGTASGAAGGSGVDAARLALIEANLQRLAQKLTDYIGAQKKSKRNIVDYGLEVIALHGMRLAITSGRATFVDLDEPLDLPYTYLQLSAAGPAREIRYIYLNSAGIIMENSSDPSNMAGYIPLALVDVWTGVTEITQDRITDLRPRAGADDNGSASSAQAQLTGNVTLVYPDTGNDSFVVSATNPAGLAVNVTHGRALVDGEVLDAEGGTINLADHRTVVQEYVGSGDGTTTSYNLYHHNVTDVTAFVDDLPTPVTVDAENGAITFAAAPAAGAVVKVTYTFGGDYMLVFLVEKAQTNDGKPFAVIGWKVGSNRNSYESPEMSRYQHAIAKVDMSGSITAITDAIIDNTFEVKNLTQNDLQNGGNLSGASLQNGAVTADKIAAGSIDAAKIVAGAIQADHIAAGAIGAGKIAANAITADMIQTRTISADKFESTTWGDLSQAMRYVKSILGGEQSWSFLLTKADLNDPGCEISNVAVLTESFPALRLAPQSTWDGEGATWDASGAQWDIPVFEQGSWESKPIDYGMVSDLQAEFWARPFLSDQACVTTVKARYSEDGTSWTEYETMARGLAGGYWFWTGTLQQFRYFRVKVEFATTDTNKYTILAYPEVRAANCKISTEDIQDATITTPKLASGAVNAEKMAASALANNISVLTGYIYHGETVPLPTGYTQNQCKWLVSVYSHTVDDDDTLYCYTDGNRVLTCWTAQRYGGYANYIIIGIK